MDWLATQTGHRADNVADLKDRPWRIGGLDVVIGVFESGHATASWLLVRYQSHWVVATVSEDTVSAVCDDLAQALRLISEL